MQKKEQIVERLYARINDLEVIDAHEHLRAEPERINEPVDFFLLFSHYTHADIHSAGLTRDQYLYLLDTNQPIEERWKVFAPVYEKIRFGSYTRAARVAAKEIYGLDINEHTYKDISERIKENNTPGLYRRILRDKCRIRRVLNQIQQLEMDREMFIPIMPGNHLREVNNRQTLQRALNHGGFKIEQAQNLDDYVDCCVTVLGQWKNSGAIGIKTYSDALIPNPDKRAAEQEFRRIRNANDSIPQEERQNLRSWLEYKILEQAGKSELVVAVHCGILWTNWENVYELHPQHMIHRVGTFRDTRFDLYHAGIPWPNEMAIYGKLFPNVYLNLCCTHIISPAMTRRALDEWLDMVPVNKILGFGGDYGSPFGSPQVEKVYGHLQMAKENIACVLADRIVNELMNFEDALHIAKDMLWNNPVNAYNLNIEMERECDKK